MQSKTIMATACLLAFHMLAAAQDKSSETDVLTIYKGAHSYKEVSVGGKTTEVYVDDAKVAAAELPHYDSLILVLRSDVDEENRELRFRDEEQDRDREAGRRDQEAAIRDQEAGRRDQEAARRDREQARRDQQEARRQANNRTRYTDL